MPLPPNAPPGNVPPDPRQLPKNNEDNTIKKDSSNNPVVYVQDNPLDTGTPGFTLPINYFTAEDINSNYSEDGKNAYTYDVGDPTREGPTTIPYRKGNFPLGDDNDPPVKDLSKGTRVKLSSYLGHLSRVNYYRLDGKVDSDSPTTKITDGNNTPPNTIKNSSYFTNKVGGVTKISENTNSPDLKNWMPPSSVDSKVFIAPDASYQNTGFVKGKQKYPALEDNILSKNGNELLPQVTKNNLGTIQKYTNSVLANNRFTGAVDNVENLNKPSEIGDTYLGVSENYANRDVKDRIDNFNPRLYTAKYGKITMDNLTRVGHALTLRASQELVDYGNPTSGLSEAGAVLPGLSQLGVSRVETYKLQASEIIKELSNDDDIRESNFISTNKLSWGTMNNVFDNYNGDLALGMMALALVLLTALTLLFELLGFIIGLISTNNNSRSLPDGRYRLGKSYGSLSSGNSSISDIGGYISKYLGLPATFHDFGPALRAGVRAYFGIDPTPTSGLNVLQAFTEGLGKSVISDSSTYSIVTARTIIRSSLTIIDSMKNFGSKASDLLTNPIAAAKSLFSLFETLRDSKIISAMKVFAMLGDQALLNKGKNTVKYPNGEPSRISSVDSIPDEEFGASHKKSRIAGQDGTNNSVKLAWSSNRAVSLYLLPKSIQALQPAMSDLGAFQSGYGMQEKESRSYYYIDSSNKKRIPYSDESDPNNYKTVEKIEQLIESTDLVPFYIQDIRTNEIVSFHAFMDNISDSYAASYDPVEGFGRVETAKIYKSTNRKVDMSFTIVATSKSDFDDMWVKINKLTTLVYPQYTEGRTLSSGDNTHQFKQPFSQMMGSSPMVRIRLGNIFTSNYSKFAMARLFGATINGAKFNNTIINFDSVAAQFEDLKEFYKSLTSKDASEGDLTQYTWLVKGGSLDAKSSAGFSVSLPLSQKTENMAKFWRVTDDASYIPVKIVKKVGSQSTAVIISPKLPYDAFLKAQGISSDKKINDIIKHITERRYENNDVEMNIIGGEYTCDISNLTLSNLSKGEIFQEKVKDAPGLQELKKFINTNNNAITKSFQSAGGKGLAGFIEAMTFDWNNFRWDVDPDARAPMGCKVTISFSPFHDITPGIDSQGYNRAPIYPVGHFKRGKGTF